MARRRYRARGREVHMKARRTRFSSRALEINEAHSILSTTTAKSRGGAPID
ncbi:MAG: hypothetical protein ACTSUE_22520 [Promethearchaeota archaeon]